MDRCVCMHIYVWIDVCIHMYIHTYRMCVYTYMYGYICVYTYISMDILLRRHVPSGLAGNWSFPPSPPVNAGQGRVICCLPRCISNPHRARIQVICVS